MNERKLYYATITEYAAMYSLHLSKRQLVEFGRLAAKISREQSIPVKSAHNTRYGSVNAYRNDVLVECFSESSSSKQTHEQSQQNSLFQAPYPHPQGKTR